MPTRFARAYAPGSVPPGLKVVSWPRQVFLEAHAFVFAAATPPPPPPPQSPPTQAPRDLVNTDPASNQLGTSVVRLPAKSSFVWTDGDTPFDGTRIEYRMFSNGLLWGQGVLQESDPLFVEDVPDGTVLVRYFAVHFNEAGDGPQSVRIEDPELTVTSLPPTDAPRNLVNTDPASNQLGTSVVRLPAKSSFVWTDGNTPFTGTRIEYRLFSNRLLWTQGNLLEFLPFEVNGVPDGTVLVRYFAVHFNEAGDGPRSVRITDPPLTVDTDIPPTAAPRDLVNTDPVSNDPGTSDVRLPAMSSFVWTDGNTPFDGTRIEYRLFSNGLLWTQGSLLQFTPTEINGVPDGTVLVRYFAVHFNDYGDGPRSERITDPELTVQTDAPDPPSVVLFDVNTIPETLQPDKRTRVEVANPAAVTEARFYFREAGGGVSSDAAATAANADYTGGGVSTDAAATAANTDYPEDPAAVVTEPGPLGGFEFVGYEDMLRYNRDYQWQAVVEAQNGTAVAVEAAPVRTALIPPPNSLVLNSAPVVGHPPAVQSFAVTTFPETPQPEKRTRVAVQDPSLVTEARFYFREATQPWYPASPAAVVTQPGPDGFEHVGYDNALRYNRDYVWRANVVGDCGTAVVESQPVRTEPIPSPQDLQVPDIFSGP